ATRERNLGRLVFGSPTETPSTVIVPFWNGSSAFTVLMRVDLPLPDGPHTTTTSPLSTSVLQSASTWKLPYHLLTSLMEIIGLGLVGLGLIGRPQSYPEAASPAARASTTRPTTAPRRRCTTSPGRTPPSTPCTPPAESRGPR